MFSIRSCWIVSYIVRTRGSSRLMNHEIKMRSKVRLYIRGKVSGEGRGINVQHSTGFAACSVPVWRESFYDCC